MNTVDRAGEVRRLAAQKVPQRVIAERLGITRHQVRRVLGAQPPTVGDPAPAQAPSAAHETARATPMGDRPARADAQPPTAGAPLARAMTVGEPVGEAGRPVGGPPVEGVVVAGAPVAHIEGAVRFPLPGAHSPWLRVDLSRRRGLLRDLVALTRVGLRIPHVVEDVLRAFAAAYHEALATGQLRRGQGYDVQIRVRPCRHAT
ncbi:hypothetical protein ACKI1J_42850 [Streptomyces scabiei]|uniref:hypothetical protein n=1 Tax=Streptomyces TaxID=1883 RepID=UPI0029B7682E|nr:hypothetical protein [Streptomyces stelliscabiei]MDX2552581.1 hypothetical protein [Streptomyces stelliscabiei]